MRGARGERGQILAVVALALVALLGVAAFSIDVGYAYYAKRQLQSATDAAALAGRPGPAERHHRHRDGDQLRAGQHAREPVLQLHVHDDVHRHGGRRDRLRRHGEPQPAHRGRHRKHEHVVRQDLRHQPLRCLHARERVQPVLVDAGRHRDRGRPHRVDVLTDRRERQLHRSRQCQGRHPHDAHGSQSTVCADRHGRVPAGPDHMPPARAAAPYNSLGGNGYDGYDSRHPRLRDRHDHRQLQDRHRRSTRRSGLYLHTDDGPATSCIQAGGNTSYSEALRQARAELAAHGRAERPRLHRLPDRRRGQHRQRLQRRRIRPTTRATPTTVAVPHRHQPGQSVQGARRDDLQHRLRAREQHPLHRAATSDRTSPPCGTGTGTSSRRGTRARHSLRAATTRPISRTRCPTISSYTTLSQIASPGNFYNQPNAGQLNTIFAAIATDIGQGSSRLVDDGF